MTYPNRGKLVTLNWILKISRVRFFSKSATGLPYKHSDLSFYAYDAVTCTPLSNRVNYYVMCPADFDQVSDFSGLPFQLENVPGVRQKFSLRNVTEAE